MKDAPYNIYARCDEHCKSERCDDYGADSCADWHTEEEHFEPGHGFCAKMAFLSHGCGICQEYWAIHRELQDGETPKRTCHECQYLFELNSENPYGDVLYDEVGTGAVYFQCNGCCLLTCCQHCSKTEESCDCPKCEECGSNVYECGGCGENDGDWDDWEEWEDLFSTEFVDDEVDRKADLVKHGRL